MTQPGFSAEASLFKTARHYRTSWNGSSVAGAEHAMLQLTTMPRLTKQLPDGTVCWCSEPDIRTVCTSSGCREQEVCLQWFCPGGQDVDEDYFGPD